MQCYYSDLKSHFDRLLKGDHPRSTGFEPIRSVYEKMFNTPINLYDVYETRISSDLWINPVGSIITLVGPFEDEHPIQYGFMPIGGSNSCNSISYVHVIDQEMYKGIITDDEKILYINDVYYTMQHIIEMDKFYASDRVASGDPYMTAIKCCPFYYTFHHIYDTIGLNDAIEDHFKNLLHKYLIDDKNDIESLMELLKISAYSRDICSVYYTMSCHNKIDLLT